MKRGISFLIYFYIFFLFSYSLFSTFSFLRCLFRWAWSCTRRSTTKNFPADKGFTRVILPACHINRFFFSLQIYFFQLHSYWLVLLFFYIEVTLKDVSQRRKKEKTFIAKSWKWDTLTLLNSAYHIVIMWVRVLLSRLTNLERGADSETKTKKSKSKRRDFDGTPALQVIRDGKDNWWQKK